MSMTLVAIVSLGFFSCSSDDDDNQGGGTSLETPKYESVSASYEVTGNSGIDVKTIELTASGDYIIIRDSYSASAAPRMGKCVDKKKGLFRKALATRAWSSRIVSGKYEKIDSTTFDLKGWGQIKITGSSDNAMSIEVTPVGSSSSYIVPVAKKEQYPNSLLTNKLCRTWSISSKRVAISLGGKQIYNKEYKVTELSKFIEDIKNLEKQYGFDDDDEYYPDGEEDNFIYPIFGEEYTETMIFTKSGTCMVMYHNGMYNISPWYWKNESKGLLYYAGLYDEDDIYRSEATISFRGNQLVFTDLLSDADDYGDDYYYDDEEDEEEGTITLTLYCDEVK